MVVVVAVVVVVELQFSFFKTNPPCVSPKGKRRWTPLQPAIVQLTVQGMLVPLAAWTSHGS